MKRLKRMAFTGRGDFETAVLDAVNTAKRIDINLEPSDFEWEKAIYEISTKSRSTEEKYGRLMNDATDPLWEKIISNALKAVFFGLTKAKDYARLLKGQVPHRNLEGSGRSASGVDYELGQYKESWERAGNGAWPSELQQWAMAKLVHIPNYKVADWELDALCMAASKGHPTETITRQYNALKEWAVKHGIHRLDVRRTNQISKMIGEEVNPD